MASARSRITSSSKRNPCPCCGRSKDSDCRFLEDGLVLCHHNTDHRAGDVIQGHDGQSWAFTGVTADQRCGIFKPDQPLPELPTPIKPRPVQAGSVWPYSATQRISRTDTASGKRFTPQHLITGHWQSGAGADPWPFYGRIPESGSVFEVEGEKCVDILLSLGYPAITHPGHNHTPEACQARYETIKPYTSLVIYIADNDQAGRTKASKCSEAAATAGVPLLVLHAEHLWPGVPEGGSVDDAPTEQIMPAITEALAKPKPRPATPSSAPAIDHARSQLQQYISEGLSGSALATKVVELATTYECQPSSLFKIVDSLLIEDEAAIAADADYELIKQQAALHVDRQKFQLEHILPAVACEPLRYFATPLQSDDLSTALIFLTCLTGAIKSGTRIWGDELSFAERPQIWLAIVGKSGLGKSPAAKRLGVANTKLVSKYYQGRNVDRHREWEAANLDIPKKDRVSEPEPYVFRIGSYTQAAITKQFMANEPERLGMLIFNDELKSLFTSLNQFQGSGKGSEEEQLLELFDNDGGADIRAKDGYRYYEEAQLSIIGGIQPAVYSQVAAKGDDNGLFARLLLLPLPLQYSGRSKPSNTSLETTERMDGILNDIILKVSALQPLPYHLTPQAAAIFQDFKEAAFIKASDHPIPAHSNIYGKRAGYILRIAGAMHIAKVACGEVQPGAPIPLDTLLMARDLVHHVQEYSLQAQSQAAQHSQGTVPDMMRRLHAYGMGKPTSAGRFRTVLTPKQRQLNSLNTINGYVQRLVDGGHAEWAGNPSGNGGRSFISTNPLPG